MRSTSIMPTASLYARATWMRRSVRALSEMPSASASSCASSCCCWTTRFLPCLEYLPFTKAICREYSRSTVDLSTGSGRQPEGDAMSAFAEKIKQTPSCREPAYRPAMYISDEEKRELDSKIGDASLYQDLVTMREMVRAQPENIELRKAMVSGIASAEFAGIDAFSRKVVEWQEWDVPPT